MPSCTCACSTTASSRRLTSASPPMDANVSVLFSMKNSRVGLGEVGREKPPQRDHADFLAERLEIGADEALRAPGDLAQIDVLGERHRARVNLQDLQPRLR